MKNSLFIALLCGLSSMLWAQDTETRSLGNFEAVHVATGIKATLQEGRDNSIEIQAAGIDLDRITSEIKNGELIVRIKSKWNSWSTRKKTVKATITYNSTLEALTVSSGAFLKSIDVINTDKMELDASSGAGLEAEINSSRTMADVSSGASIEVRGRSERLDVDASSGARFEGYDLKAEDVSVEGSSGSTIRVHAVASIEADVSSGSHVKYKGTPSKKDIEKSSGGNVRASSRN